VALLTLPITAQAAAPAVDFRESEVVVRELTPGGRAIFWWLAQGISGFTPWTSRLTEVVLDEDGDGVVSVPFDGGVPEDSLWAVVDLTSGEYTLASPAVGPLREVDPPRGLVASLPGRGEIEDERRRLEVLVVRPGTDGEAGAWTGGADDGGAGDGDGRRDGRTQARLERLEPLEEEGPPPPRALRAGDLVVAGDARDLVFWARRLPEDRTGDEGDETGEGGKP
jgi:hypothetical protein